jgi:hypothetical protein
MHAAIIPLFLLVCVGAHARPVRPFSITVGACGFIGQAKAEQVKVSNATIANDRGRIVISY